MNYWVAIYRFALGLLIVLVTIIAICIFIPQIQRVRELDRKIAELEQSVNEVEAATKELQIKQERFVTDPAFVERTAKESGLLKPDEIVFKFTNEQENAQ